MVAENTKEMRNIKNVTSSLAIENMFVSQDLIEEVIKVDKGEKTYEELIDELKIKYKKL